MAFPIPASSITSGRIASIWWGASPMARHPRRTFRSPDRSGTRAALTPSSTGLERALTVPDVGVSKPAITRRRVDFPAPLRPRIPIDSPARATKEMPLRASTLTFGLCPVIPRKIFRAGDVARRSSASVEGTR